MKTYLPFILLIIPQAHAIDSRLCNVGDLQACRSCDALVKAVAKSHPNDGEYYRGARWNGLYAAYVHDCIAVGKDLLERGANPNWGGASGSMIISVSNKWPHGDKAINQKWASLILKHGASGKRLVPEENKTPNELLKDYKGVPDYPDIWALFHR